MDRESFNQPALVSDSNIEPRDLVYKPALGCNVGKEIDRYLGRYLSGFRTL